MKVQDLLLRFAECADPEQQGAAKELAGCLGEMLPDVEVVMLKLAGERDDKSHAVARNVRSPVQFVPEGETIEETIERTGSYGYVYGPNDGCGSKKDLDKAVPAIVLEY